MFRLYIQPSSGLKEISPGTKKCVLYGIPYSLNYMGSHIVHTLIPGLISLRPDDG